MHGVGHQLDKPWVVVGALQEGDCVVTAVSMLPGTSPPCSARHRPFEASARVGGVAAWQSPGLGEAGGLRECSPSGYRGGGIFTLGVHLR